MKGNAFSMKGNTIYDIAKIAAVSPSTVSRVINGNPRVSKTTRERIRKIIDECHYVPNEAARGLVTQSSRLVGILISDIRLTHHADGVYYVERELMRSGYCCLILNTGVEEQEYVRYIQMLSQRKAEAVVLMGSIYQTATMQQAIETYLPNTPILFCNGYLDLPNVYGVIADEQFGIVNCVQLLAQKGKRCPAFIMDRQTPSNLAKRQGFEYAALRFLHQDAPLVSQTDRTRHGAYAATQQLLQAHPEVDGIIYSDDALAAVGMRALLDMDRRIPEDVAVIGVNNSFFAELCTPRLTSLDNMLYDQSLTAVRTLRTVLAGEHANRRVMICSEIIEREST